MSNNVRIPDGTGKANRYLGKHQTKCRPDPTHTQTIFYFYFFEGTTLQDYEKTLLALCVEISR